MKQLFLTITFVLGAQFTLAQETTTSAPLSDVNFELEEAIMQAQQLDTPNDERGGTRDFIRLLARLKLQWFRAAMAFSDEGCDQSSNQNSEECTRLQQTMAQARAATGEVSALAASIPAIVGINLGVAASEFLRRMITESGKWRLLHKAANWGVGFFSPLIGYKYVKGLRAMDSGEKREIVNELELAIRALEVTNISSFTAVQDLVGADSSWAQEVNLPLSDPSTDNRVERFIQRASLTNRYVEKINQRYEEQFGNSN